MFQHSILLLAVYCLGISAVAQKENQDKSEDKCADGSAPRPRAGGDSEGTPPRFPRVSMDYFFLSQADEKADKNPLIVMVDAARDRGRC